MSSNNAQNNRDYFGAGVMLDNIYRSLGLIELYTKKTLILVRDDLLKNMQREEADIIPILEGIVELINSELQGRESEGIDL